MASKQSSPMITSRHVLPLHAASGIAEAVWSLRHALIDSLYGSVPCLFLVPISDLGFLLDCTEYEYKTSWKDMIKEEGIRFLLSAWEKEADRYLG